MTAGQIAAYLTGLFVCYFTGVKFGVVVSAIKKLGTSA